MLQIEDDDKPSKHKENIHISGDTISPKTK
jgi:hypothetical protein